MFSEVLLNEILHHHKSGVFAKDEETCGLCVCVCVFSEMLLNEIIQCTSVAF